MNTEAEYFTEGGLVIRWERDSQPPRENIVVLQGDMNIKELYRGVDNSLAKAVFDETRAHYEERKAAETV